MKKLLIALFAFAMVFGVAGAANASLTIDTNKVSDISDGFFGTFIFQLEDDGTLDVLKVNQSTGVPEMFDENILTDIVEIGDVALSDSFGYAYFATLKDDGIAENHYLEVQRYHLSSKALVDYSVFDQTSTGNIMFDLASRTSNSELHLAYATNEGSIYTMDLSSEAQFDTGYDLTWDTNVDSLAAFAYTDRVAIMYETDAGATYSIKEAVVNTSSETGIGDYTVNTALSDVNDLDAIQKNVTADAVDFMANYVHTDGPNNIIDYYVLDTPASATEIEMIDETSINVGANMDATKDTTNTDIVIAYEDKTTTDQVVIETYNTAGTQQGARNTVASITPDYIEKDYTNNTSIVFGDGSTNYSYDGNNGLLEFGQQEDAIPELPGSTLWKVLIAVLALGLVVGIAAFMRKKK